MIARPGEPALSLVEDSVVNRFIARLFAERHQEHHFDAMITLEDVSIDDEIDPKTLNSSKDDIANRTLLLENEIRFIRRTCSDLTTIGQFNPAPGAEGRGFRLSEYIVFESLEGEIIISGAATVQSRRGGGTRAPRAQNTHTPPLDDFIAVV